MKRNSQVKIVKRRLLKGHSISSLDATLRFGITRLSARIKNLKDAGFIISDYWAGKGQSKFKQYFIKEENL